MSVVDQDGRAVRAPGLAAWVATVAPARVRGSLAIAILSDRRVRALNRQYRGVDKATDVLSFPAAPGPALTSDRARTAGRARTSDSGRTPDRGRTSDHGRTENLGPGTTHPFLGDIVIARGVAARQAREAGHAERIEWRVLALHGLLHLLGYDHERDDGEMRRLETRLRRKGGLPAGLTERGGRP